MSKPDFKKKLLDNFISNLLSQDEIIYNIIESFAIEALKRIDISQLLDVLDQGKTANEILPSIQGAYVEEIKKRIKNASRFNPARVKNLAYHYLTKENVLNWLRQADVNIYAIIINHKNGMMFIESLIQYILDNIDIFLS